MSAVTLTITRTLWGGHCYHPHFKDEKTEASWRGRVTGLPSHSLLRAELACRPRQPRHHITRSCHLPVSSGRGQFSSFLFLSTVWWPPCRTVSLQLSKGQVGLKWSVCQVPRGTTEEEPYIRKTVFYPWGLRFIPETFSCL